MHQTTMITTRTSNIIMMNDVPATASFIFDYSLLFQLYEQLDATVENGILHLNPFARFDNGQYGLSNWFRWYEAIFLKFTDGKTFLSEVLLSAQ